MKMQSLKQKYSELSKPVGADSDEYYQSIYFDENQMKAMGLERARVGDDLMLCFKARVSSTSESKNGSASISLELIEGAIEEEDKNERAATVLYGER